MTDQPPETPPATPGQVPHNPGQAPGAYPPPGQYPPGQYAYQPVYMAPKHPQATLAMVLGIVGLTGIFCYITAVVAPFAWWIGAKAAREIKADPARYGGHGEASAGKIMGIIGTVLLILGLLVLAGFITLLVASADFREGFESDWDEYNILGTF